MDYKQGSDQIEISVIWRLDGRVQNHSAYSLIDIC